jgi:response regulator RpfG family c-di-GMP phosphodiesterase
MPEMDGAVVCRKIRQNKEYDEIKIIFLTIMKKLPGMERLLEGSGVSYYITKPFENEDLLEKVSKALEKK